MSFRCIVVLIGLKQGVGDCEIGEIGQIISNCSLIDDYILADI